MLIQVGVAWDENVDQELGFLKTLGVDHICMKLTSKTRNPDLGSAASAAKFFAEARDKVRAHGMDLRCVSASNAPGWAEVKLGLPGAEQKIGLLRNLIKGMGAAGIPMLLYNFRVLHSTQLRTEPTQGRGEASYVSFDYEQFKGRPPAAAAAAIPEDAMWANITRFLKAIVPEAELAGVRLALHPDDPPLPPGIAPLTEVANIVSTFEQYRRIFGICPSPANAMLFCQGCVKEMQGVDVYQAIRDMASQDKIVAVHFRNVRGSFPRFQETFVDDGDVDMYKAMVAYRDAGFRGPFMLDHGPSFPQAHPAGNAFAIGYIRAMIQAVYR